MKKISAICTLLLIVGLCTVASAFDIKLGTTVLSIAFDDESLTENEKIIIVKDIKSVLATTPSSAKLKRLRDAEKKHKDYDGWIDVGAQGHFWPRAYQNSFGHYRYKDKSAKPQLVVSKELSDAYRRAMRFREANVEAFDKLYRFISRINNGLDISNMSLTEKRALFWFPPGGPVLTKEKHFDKNIRGLNKHTIHYPSILTFKEGTVDDRSLLYCKPVMTSKNGSSFIDQIILVYDEGMWRLRAF